MSSISEYLASLPQGLQFLLIVLGIMAVALLIRLAVQGADDDFEA